MSTLSFHEDQFSKIAILGEEDAIVSQCNLGNVPVIGARPLLINRRNVVSLAAQRPYDPTMNALICQETQTGTLLTF